jgi:hypothetical protein
MFPKRRIFLEGLLRQKLIRGARLFISDYADNYLKRNYVLEELPSYANVSDQHTSIIYLKLDKAHIVEGSHMHKFWIYRDILENTPPNNYKETRFSRQALSNIKSESVPWCTSHGGFWQAKIISQLDEMGISIDPELVLDDDDYRQYRKSYEIRRR